MVSALLFHLTTFDSKCFNLFQNNVELFQLPIEASNLPGRARSRNLILVDVILLLRPHFRFSSLLATKLVADAQVPRSLLIQDGEKFQCASLHNNAQRIGSQRDLYMPRIASCFVEICSNRVVAACLSVCLFLSVSIPADTDEAITLPTYSGCEFEQGDTDEIIVAGNLVLGEVEVTQGAVLIAEGKISKIGKLVDIRLSAPNASLFDCKDSYISPGFINPHEHLSHSGGIPDPETKPIYEHRDEWRGVFGEKYAVEFHSVEEPEHDIWIELRHLLAGTTTLGSGGGVEGLVKNATNESTADGYLIDYEIFPYGWVSKFHDLDCSDEPTDVVPRMSDDENLSGAPYVAHIAEGTNCAATLEGRAFLDYVEQNPNRRYALIHGVGLDTESVARLKELDVTLIWAPRSNIALYDKTIDVVNVLKSGAHVALGSDWSFSGSYNMLEEIQCADRIDNVRWKDQLSGEDFWIMATRAAAYSLGIESVTGRLEEGYAADIVVLRNRTGDFFTDLLAYVVSDVIATFVDGELRSGYVPAFNGTELPLRCRKFIDQHFVCGTWAGEQSSLDEFVRMNRELEDFVPLFEPKSQAACLDED